MKYWLIVGWLTLGCSSIDAPREQKTRSAAVATKESSEEQHKLRAYAKQAVRYCRQQDMNGEWAILIDLAQHSGLKRMYVYDLKGDSVLLSAMVSHGCGAARWGADETREGAVFSNQEGSHCSSLGKYKIGERGLSQWGIGIKYLLHGLELRNSNALKRSIVLHSWERVPDEEVYPRGVAEGWGCPAVADSVMRYLDNRLKVSNRSVLLWIYGDEK
jgi:hypothetical protein